MVKVFIAGDYLNGKENKHPFSNELVTYINDADIAMCNFESPVNSEGQPIPKIGAHIVQPESNFKILKEVGFTHLNLANNHICDYGKEGLSTTIHKALKYDLETIGAGLSWDEAYSVKVETVNSKKIGFLSFAETEFGSMFDKMNDDFGYAYINHPEVNNLVSHTKKQVNFLILNVHAGVEQSNIPLPEWRDRYKQLIDLGADAIIGHHPHVPQGWEVYNERPIFYSLGNFYFDYFELDKDEIGYAVQLELDEGRVAFSIIPYRNHNNKIELNLSNQQTNEIQKLNSYIGADYEANMKAEIVKLYNERYQNYYSVATNSIMPNMPLKKKLAKVYRLLFRTSNGIENRNLMLLHNIRIDSHRYVTQRALSLLWEKKKQ